MRRANKKDDNQSQIEKRINRVGVQTIDTSMLKGETFDMITIWRGVVSIVEVKNPAYFPKYFFNLDEEKQRDYLETLLTDNELKTKEKIERGGSVFIITWDADHLLKQLGGLSKPFSKSI